MINPSTVSLTVSYLRARTYKGLVRKANLNNKKFRLNFKYSEFVQDKKDGAWYTNFNFQLENIDQLNEELEKING